VEQWKKKDPIERLRKYLEKGGLWNKAYAQAVSSEAKQKVESAVHEEEGFPPPDPLDIFRFTYQDLTVDLREQMESFVNANGKRDQRE
jgi:TPP-dependent pyruvate/acetoin dehydrogenase alpha subunit